ncbi:hypothetical protein D7Z54_28930 [Salibacterium salarium]|uniref:Uncharacterized protein n=1 Tax=Salibacterium salarium TaxID=284579 RepID=A0A428MUR0_9BACI|nr:hypothetical protein [Salibacterium salarium]RSL29893.1 hypothetical protein D7Z54_28930 [Salibacterium salarium]
MSKWTVAQLGIACLLAVAAIMSEVLRESMFVPNTGVGPALPPLYFISVVVVAFLALHFFCYLELKKEKNVFKPPFLSYIGKISFVLLVVFIIGTMATFVSLSISTITSDFRFAIYVFVFVGMALIYFTLFGFVRAFVTGKNSSVMQTIKVTTGAGLVFNLILLLF